MSWHKVAARAFMERAQTAGIDVTEHGSAIEQTMASVLRTVKSAADDEAKKAALCQLVLFDLDNGMYGDPGAEPIRSIRLALIECFDEAELARHGAQDLWNRVREAAGECRGRRASTRMEDGDGERT